MKNCPPKYTAVVVDLPSIRKAKCYRKEPFHGRISNCSIVPHATFPVPLLKPKRPHIADGSRNAYSLVPEDNSSTTGKLSFTGWSHQTGMVLYTPNVKRVLSTSFPSHRCKGVFPPSFFLINSMFYLMILQSCMYWYQSLLVHINQCRSEHNQVRIGSK